MSYLARRLMAFCLVALLFGGVMVGGEHVASGLSFDPCAPCDAMCCYSGVDLNGSWRTFRRNIGQTTSNLIRHFVTQMMPSISQINKLLIATEATINSGILPALDSGSTPEPPPDFPARQIKKFLTDYKRAPEVPRPEIGSPLQQRLYRLANTSSRYFGLTAQRYHDLQEIETLLIPMAPHMSVNELMQAIAMLKSFTGTLEQEQGVLTTEHSRVESERDSVRRMGGGGTRNSERGGSGDLDINKVPSMDELQEWMWR